MRTGKQQKEYKEAQYACKNKRPGKEEKEKGDIGKWQTENGNEKGEKTLEEPTQQDRKLWKEERDEGERERRGQDRRELKEKRERMLLLLRFRIDTNMIQG